MLVIAAIFSLLLQITNGRSNPKIQPSCVNRFKENDGNRKCPPLGHGFLEQADEHHFPVTCKNMKVDVGFLLDASASMRNQFQSAKIFLKFVATAFSVTDSRIGVISFGNRTFLNLALNEHTNSSSFNNAVDAISLVGSTARRDKALRLAQDFFTSRRGTWIEPSKLLILLTGDSRPHEATVNEIEAIAELVRRNIRVIVVGIGPKDNKTVFTRGARSSENVFHARSFEEHLRSNVTDIIIGKYCRKIKFPVWPWVREELIRKQTPITRNNAIGVLDMIDLEYKVILQFLPRTDPKGWGNVIHFTIGGNDENIYGERIPAVYYHGTDNKIEISSSVSGNAFFYNHVSSVSPNIWHTIEITQERDGVEYFYSVSLNGNDIVRVVNKRPEIFYNVSVYASDPWYIAQGGSVRILNYYKKEVMKLPSAMMRMPAKIKGKDKEAYTRTAGVVLSVGFLAIIGAGFL